MKFKAFSIVQTFSIILVIFLGFLFFSFNYFLFTYIKESYVKLSSSAAKAMSNQIYKSMVQIMKEGISREEITRFLKDLKNIYKDTASEFEVELYRANKVIELFGKVSESKKSKEVLEVLKTGEGFFSEKNYLFIYIYPIKAEKTCLKCHVNARESDILGAIKIKINLKKSFTDLNNKLFTL